MRARLALAITFVAASFAGVARAETRVITVEEAVRLALAEHPRVRGAEQRVYAAEDTERSVRGRMLPAVRVANDYQHYGKEFAIAFPSAAGAPTQFVARDRDANTFVASVEQPLVGLLPLAAEKSARARGVDAAEAEARTARADVKEALEVGFLRLFEARSLEGVARASQSELGEQVNVAQAKLGAGVLTNADVLRVRVALANAKQQELVAHAQAEVARAQLLGALGLPPDDRGVDFAEPKTLLARARGPRPSIAAAQREGMERRADVALLRAQAEAARGQSRARSYALLPDVSAQAAYVRVDGQVFAPQDSIYVGLKAQWPLFEWGASWYAHKAAEHQAEAAERAVESATRQVGVEVAGNLAQSSAAASAVALAEQTIESAEEAYRVTNALQAAGSATTTDVLDAEAALTQARLNLTRAQYELAVADVVLARALGR